MQSAKLKHRLTTRADFVVQAVAKINRSLWLVPKSVTWNDLERHNVGFLRYSTPFGSFAANYVQVVEDRSVLFATKCSPNILVFTIYDLWQFAEITENGGSTPTGSWLCMLSPAAWLPWARDQLRPLTVDYDGYLYLLPRTNTLTRGIPLSKAIIWPLLCGSWKTVQEWCKLALHNYSLIESRSISDLEWPWTV